MTRRPRRGLYLRLERLDDRCLPATLVPAQILHAYGLDHLQLSNSAGTVAGDGTGQTIAIVVAQHDPYLKADLAEFDRTYGLPDSELLQIYAPGTATDDGWASEETLDVEYAHAVAPAAKIVVVEAKSSDTSSMISAIDTARNYPGVSVVSMSWGVSEPGNERALDYHFMTPTGHTGVTFVAAAGDSSASGGAEWPSTSPYVLAVGGTRLQVDGLGNYQNETAWGSSGGGYSVLEPAPSYQKGFNSKRVRSVPDVAALASMSSAVNVLTTTPSDGQQTWWQIGGTSVGTPIWAGIVAIVNQGRAVQGRGTLDGASQTMPAIYAMPPSAFHDVTSGSNGFSAKAGYDLVTGRGSPNGPVLVSGLTAWTGVAPLTHTPTPARKTVPAKKVKKKDVAAPLELVISTADLAEHGQAGRPGLSVQQRTKSGPLSQGPATWGFRHVGGMGRLTTVGTLRQAGSGTIFRSPERQ